MKNTLKGSGGMIHNLSKIYFSRWKCQICNIVKLKAQWAFMFFCTILLYTCLFKLKSCVKKYVNPLFHWYIIWGCQNKCYNSNPVAFFYRVLMVRHVNSLFWLIIMGINFVRFGRKCNYSEAYLISSWENKSYYFIYFNLDAAECSERLSDH